MNRVKVNQTIRIYEEDDVELPIGVNKHLGIESHWNNHERVILLLGKKRVTVIGSDLLLALHNAMHC